MAHDQACRIRHDGGTPGWRKGSYTYNIRVAARTAAVISAYAIIISGTCAQAGNAMVKRVTDVEMLIAWYVTGKRIVGGHIQRITGCATNTPPVGSETVSGHIRRRVSYWCRWCA